MNSRFEQRLAGGPVIVGDGGMGVLVTSAVPRLRCPEEANLRAPESVVTLHTSFIRAGADMIETNTFGANRRKLAEQARILDGRGVDLFMVETFYDLDELETAIEAVRSVSSLPIVATLTFDEGAETLAGVTAREAAARLRPLELAAIGANHGSGLHAALAALEEMGGDGGPPLAALPNVGLASLSGGRVIYPHATPEYFAEFAAHARELGARLIGGCCGTTPLEIAAIRSAVAGERIPRGGRGRAARGRVSRARGPAAEESLRAGMPSGGAGAPGCELGPPKGGNYEG